MDWVRWDLLGAEWKVIDFDTLTAPTDEKTEYGYDWQPVVRVGRTIPFGYVINKEDSELLDPVPYELEALDLARKHVKQFSYREVANWLTTKTGRNISHVGLRKRLMHEQQRKNKARTLRKWSEYAEKAIQKAKTIEESRVGAKA